MKKFKQLLRSGVSIARRFLLEEVLAGVTVARGARQKIEREIEDAHSRTQEHLRPVTEGLTLDDLRRYTSSEEERRKSIEDKAKNNVIAITIGFPVLFAGLNFLVSKDALAVARGWWAIGALSLLILGVAYLISGGLKALAVLQVFVVYIPTPEWESFLTEEDRKTNLLWCVQQNVRFNLLRTNTLVVSYQCIRNGVLTLAALILLLAGLILVADLSGKHEDPLARTAGSQLKK